MMPALRAESLSKRFLLQERRPRTLRESLTRLLTGERSRAVSHWALRDVSFSVPPGKTFGIIGQNGAGKSTLLRLLCGLSRPTSGRVVAAGRVSGILELGGGFDPNLTGRQNLVTAGILNGLTPAQIAMREPRIIAFAELEAFIDQPTRTYSSGMYLRLAFAAALEFEPSVLVLDEVLAVGDERFQRKCLERIVELKSRGTTLIVTSHSAEQITTVCDEVLVLDEGRVVMQGAAREALNAYRDLLRRRTEARAAGAVARVALAESVTRSGQRLGTNEAAITDVQLRSLAGEPVAAIDAHAGLRIVLSYRKPAAIPDLALLLGIYDRSNVKCFEAPVGSMASTFGTLAAEGTVSCTLEALPLLPERYFVNVGLYPTDWKFVYDYHWQMHPIDIVGPCHGFDAPSGIVAMDARWGSMGPQRRSEGAPEAVAC